MGNPPRQCAFLPPLHHSHGAPVPSAGTTTAIYLSLPCSSIPPPSHGRFEEDGPRRGCYDNAAVYCPPPLLLAPRGSCCRVLLMFPRTKGPSLECTSSTGFFFIHQRRVLGVLSRLGHFLASVLLRSFFDLSGLYHMRDWPRVGGYLGEEGHAVGTEQSDRDQGSDRMERTMDSTQPLGWRMSHSRSWARQYVEACSMQRIRLCPPLTGRTSDQLRLLRILHPLRVSPQIPSGPR